ncbi:hypothetical protein BDV10DRAFT_71164 [Aspergillus recurvatus]
MPALYCTITYLIDPAWIYLTGSHWRLYSMLHDFTHTQFSASTGPILMKNLIYTGVRGLLKFLAEESSLEYKGLGIEMASNAAIYVQIIITSFASSHHVRCTSATKGTLSFVKYII